MITRVNNITHQIGLGGVFHGGIAIDGVEWSFGYCDAGTGVYSCKPTKVSSRGLMHQFSMHHPPPGADMPCGGHIPSPPRTASPPYALRGLCCLPLKWWVMQSLTLSECMRNSFYVNACV